MAINSRAKNARKYYDGDHWYSWIGPVPASAEREEDVKRVFVSINLVKECVDRHARCLIGKFPNWYLLDQNGERTDAAEEAEAQLQRWINKVFDRAASADYENPEECTNPFFDAIVSMLLEGQSHLRLWQPQRFIDMDDPTDRIYLHSIRKGGAELFYNPADKFLDYIRYTYGDGKNERQTIDGDMLTIETGQIDDDGNEVIYEIDTGGRWSIVTLQAESIITEQICQLQDALNFSVTMMMRDQEQSGFLERLFLNIQPPGTYTTDSEGNTIFVPEPMTRGVGIDQFLHTRPSDNGEAVNGQVIMSEPVGPDHYLKTIDRLIDAIYNQFGQGHMVTVGDGVISGVSRVQIRADFEQMLLQQSAAVSSALANVFNVVLRVLGYDQFTCVVQMRPSTGKLLPEESKAAIEEYNAGLLDQAGAIAALGRTDDPDGIIELIEEDRQRQLEPVTEPQPEDLDDAA